MTAIGKAIFLSTLLFTLHFAIVVANAQPIIIGYSGAGVSTDLRLVINAEKLWAKRGLNVKSVYFTSGAVLAQAMAAGDIQVSDSDVPAMLNLGVSGILDLKVVAVTVNRLEHFFVVQKSLMKPQDLKGKRVAVSGMGSASDITTRMVLRYWKLSPEKDLTILSAGNTPSRIAALTIGHVDAALVSPDHVSRILVTGCCRILADLSELPLDYARFGILVPTAMIQSRRDTVRNLLMTYTEGIHSFKTHPDVALAALAHEGIKDPKVAKDVYRRLSQSYREDPVPEPVGVQAALDSVPNPRARGFKAEDVTDTTIMEEIRKSGFIKQLYGR